MLEQSNLKATRVSTNNVRVHYSFRDKIDLHGTFLKNKKQMSETIVAADKFDFNRFLSAPIFFVVIINSQT